MFDLILYAIPFFVASLAVEWITFRHDAEDRALIGYEPKDTATSLTMGVGNVVINIGWKLVAIDLDKNYGGITIVWDRLVGTFQPETERVRYGLTENIHTFNPIKVATHEYAAIVRDVRRADTWGERFGYVFRAPGWAYARRP
jgi:hypothetical protein